MSNSIRGIMFDMDNTLLKSTIDFAAMKQDTYDFLRSRRLLPEGVGLEGQTTSTLIESAVEVKRMSEEQLEQVWNIAVAHEKRGMKGARLEPGVTSLLEQLRGRFLLTIVTNNSVTAAMQALEENRIAAYFDCVAGRETMGRLKPYPDGFLSILGQYPDIHRNEWLAVGDSWIDGKAAAEAGVPFIAYRADEAGLNRANVKPAASIRHMGELLPILGVEVQPKEEDTSL
ncbi:HAD family hydrolase [Paenibacillus turpanensis]|uniref:HAD family hydrolase n=1 Tax=Paenibacillus turpanensis TaxID=2689078 RepID=UPI0014090CBF|nr:HAD-IA family hydrolase [Paenibacillus turpanensis]